MNGAEASERIGRSEATVRRMSGDGKLAGAVQRGEKRRVAYPGERRHDLAGKKSSRKRNRVHHNKRSRSLRRVFGDGSLQLA